MAKKKQVYNHATGEHQDAATQMNTTEWWQRLLFGLSPKSLQNRKKKVDKTVSEQTQ